MVDEKQEKPDLAKLFDVAIGGKLADMRICLPAKVVSYDRSTQTCKAAPSLKRKYKNGDIVDLPIINKVPVCFPGSRSMWFHFDLEPGDDITLVFSERSLDLWKLKGEPTTPEDPRKFNLSDAYAMPGGNPPVNPIKLNGPEGSIEMSNKENYFRIEEDGKIHGGNSGGFFEMDKAGKFQLSNKTEELLDLLDQLTNILYITTTNTIFGPMKLNHFAQIQVINTKIKTLKGDS